MHHLSRVFHVLLCSSVLVGGGLFPTPVFAADPAAADKQSEEYQIGVMVKAIQQAIDSPERPDSLATIVKYGQDSRHYVMIRGWLTQILQGTESVLSSTGDPEIKTKLTTKRDFLRKAIRRIDLE